MAKRIKLNLPGFRELRTSKAADDLVFGLAEKVAAKAGPDFIAERSPSKNRARATVTPNTAEAARETATNPERLIGAMDAARRG